MSLKCSAAGTAITANSATIATAITMSVSASESRYWTTRLRVSVSR